MLLTASLFSAPMLAFAQVDAIRQGVDAAARPAGIQTTACQGTQCIVTMVGNAVNIALSFLGVLLLVYLLYAGFLWTTAGGDPKQVGSAQTMIWNAIIGLAITVSAFAISSFVISQLGSITDSSSAPAPTAQTNQNGTGNAVERQGAEPGRDANGNHTGPRGPVAE